MTHALSNSMMKACLFLLVAVAVADDAACAASSPGCPSKIQVDANTLLQTRVRIDDELAPGNPAILTAQQIEIEHHQIVYVAHLTGLTGDERLPDQEKITDPSERTSGVTGEVVVFQSKGAYLTFFGHASHLESSLSACGDVTNGCGVSVHSGQDGSTACLNPTTQGGIFFQGDTDPWAPYNYQSTSSEGFAGFSGTIANGMGSVAGKSFIVHNSAGKRIACGVLKRERSGVDYSVLSALSSSRVTAKVTTYRCRRCLPPAILAAGSAVGLLDALSSSGSTCTAPNGCGPHVHSGNGCANNAIQGGRFFNTSTTTWSYKRRNELGAGLFAMKADGEAPLQRVSGKAFVVYDNAGSRVACGVLNPLSAGPQSVYTATLTAFGSTGVTGEVTVFQRSGTSVTIIGSASGLEASAEYPSPQNVTSSYPVPAEQKYRGPHVHIGTAGTDACTQSGTRPDPWTSDQPGTPLDPWDVIMYPSNSGAGAGTFAGSIYNKMLRGEKWDNYSVQVQQLFTTCFSGMPFILHNDAGDRVACGLLSEVTSGVDHTDLASYGGSDVTGAFTTYTTSSVVLAVGNAFGADFSRCRGWKLYGTRPSTGCVAVLSGEACTDSAVIGGHHFSTNSDPWGKEGYMNECGDDEYMFAVKATAGVTSVSGKALLLDTNMGSNVACGVLEATPTGTTGNCATDGPNSTTGSTTGDATDNTTGKNGFVAAAHSSNALMVQLALMAATFCMIS